ncbi:hypothetical protein Q1695_014916 [Nippostrongylus brasiliensis]|nr:hypothetical protein Q1695_014916 [Nippostrongylus brasiliensis]
MPLLRRSHAGAVDEPSTSKENRDDSEARGDEKYLSYVMHLLRERRIMRRFLEKRQKQLTSATTSRWKSLVTLESTIDELEQRVLEDIAKEDTDTAQQCTSRGADDSVISSGRMSPIEVKVDPEQTVQSAPTNSLLSVNTKETQFEWHAKREVIVLSRVDELKKAGLWSASRLPLCVEPPRNKTHWDFVLEEMKWMATDFRMERQFKRNIARKIASAIQKQKRDTEMEMERSEMRLIREGKRICSSIAKMVRDFWQSVDKVVEHRAQEILESKKRRALDAHMAFIVGEADKLSSIVQEGLTNDRASKTPSVTSEADDADFRASESESDDEMTIEREEAAMREEGMEDVKDEVTALSKDADQDMDDFLASLPPEYLASLGLQLPSGSNDKTESPADSEGEEDTNSVKQKSHTSKSDKGRKHHEDEKEGSKPKRPKLEEASDEDSSNGKRGAEVLPADVEVNKHEEDEISVDEEETDRVQDQNTSLEGNGDGRGMLESVDYEKLNSVKTAVPFLIRGTLREYQLVGLDWLVTLYEKNLNGILADEMGLGKTIQTISLLAHLACCESIWGPHLIIVPTSVILNWEMELKKWCPAFKILTYFGSQKDRAEKRRGWMKPNAFHVCITSYKTVTTDIRAFKKRAWQYLILDEAQNIKNFKSQRWQALLNVRARRRLLLTGTPLQNSLMELWSLMHFLMPAIFASHDDFKDWFSNPLTGMMEGSVEFNAPLVQQLHKVLRPFILRRLKSEVEKQLPKKTEHVIKCSLSKRQRYLYDDFMSRRTTRDNLKSGNMLSVLNIVMQLRKCCNHPNLFEPRAVQSPMCLHQLRLNFPGLLVDLNEKVFGRDIPEFFDLRKRFTGVSTSTVGRTPLIEELAECEDVRPPVVSGFRLTRPISSSTGIHSAAHSSELGSGVDVSTAELQRAGFAQDEMVLVVRDGDDTDGLLGNNAGGPVPMRVKIDDGRLVLDPDGFKQHGASLKLCQVVTGANGERTIRELPGRTGEQHTGGNAPVPVSQVANPAPAAIAAMPGGAASTAVIAPTVTKLARATYGHSSSKPNINVHPFLRCTTVVSKVSPLTVSTAASGFNHVMQNGGIRDNESNETMADLTASLSPPMKKRRLEPPSNEAVAGEFADLVPVEVLQRMEENGRLRLQRIVQRFEGQQRPLYSTQLISLIERSVSNKIDFDCGWRTRGEMESSVRFDVRESMTEWVAEVLKRFWIWVNPAVTEPPLLETSFSGRGYHARVLEQNVAAASRELVSMVHPLTHSALVASQLHFPELRLIEYDCGKLQALSRLLRRLYALKHRCLIFTQMSRMLDVLQAFLSYHGYQYFRLDGTTGIEQRQAMMERFNADTRIFCFILSTRSGGVGVNLTGADTVIFYDSDWNPTMDAQAQDRCHRIGQTRNVTIFRLISEKTIEENILRKANQKRRLGEMAIDDAGFTPEFFKQSDNLRDLFDGDVEVGDIDDRPKSQKDVEKAMATVEDEQDVTAAKMVLLEAKADTAEFDENARTAEASGTFVSYLDSEEPLDEKYIELISQLKPIERYAVNFLEAEYKPDFDEEVKEAEAMIDQKREDWVRAHNKALSNGDVEMEVDDNSSRVDDDFYGAGILLDEVRSRRKIRVTASSGAVAARTAPSRHSVRLAAPQPQKPSPSKTLSGRRIIAPHALAVPLNSPRSVSASIAPQKSAAHTAARSAVRKAAVRATTQRRKRIAADNDSNGSRSPESSRSSPVSNETKRRRRKCMKMSAEVDTPGRGSDHPEEKAMDKMPSTPKNLKEKTPPVLKATTEKTSPVSKNCGVIQRPTIKTNFSPTTARPSASFTSTASFVRPSTIAGSVLTTSAPPSITSSPQRTFTSAPIFKSPNSVQTRFPVRTLSRHSQLSSPSPSCSSTPHPSPSQSRVTFSSPPVRLPVHVVQTQPQVPRQLAQPTNAIGQPVHIRQPVFVRRTAVRVPVTGANAVPIQRSQHRYVVVGRSAGNVPMMVSTSAIRPPGVPVRRVIVQARSSTQTVSPVVNRPGLGEYERPRLQFRHRPSGQDPTDDQ